MNEDMPASDTTEYIRWAGGLFGLSFVTVRIRDGVGMFFTAEEWSSLSTNNCSKYLHVGVRIRVDHRQFAIAKNGCTDDISGHTFEWRAHGTSIRGAEGYGNGNQGFYETVGGK